MRNDFYYNSQDGFTQIHAVEWTPSGTVTGVIQICHGMAEYIDRYAEFAEYMSSQGYYVVGNDHLGHGKSVRSEKYLGHFQEYKGNSFVIGDIRTLQEMSLEKYPGLPYIMMGHSMGSFLVRQYLTEYGQDVSAAIIMGTGEQSAIMLKVARLLCKIIASFKGWKHQSTLIDNMAIGSYNKKFQPEKTGVEWLSANEENCVRYVADPLCGFKFTLGGFNQMFAGMETLTKADKLAKMPIDIPVLLISGAEDPVGDFGKGVKKVYKTFREQGLRDVTIRLYPGDRHEILKEDNREAVMDDILSWIYGGRENLADEKFPKANALEMKPISLKEKTRRSPLTPEMIVAEFEEVEEEIKQPEPKKLKLKMDSIKMPEMPVVKPSVKAVVTEPVVIAPELKRTFEAKPEEKKPVTEFYKFSEPMVFVDMNAQKGLTPLVSVNEEGKTESDIIAERLAAIMSGTYVFEDELAAEAEAKAAAEAQEKAAREAAAMAAMLREETENPKPVSVAAPAKAPKEAEPAEETFAEPEAPSETPVKEPVKPKKEKKIRYLSEEDELLAFIEKLEAEKIAKGEPLAVYVPENPEEKAEEEAPKVAPGPILAGLASTTPIVADLEAEREAAALAEGTEIVDLNELGDVLDEISGDQKNAVEEDLEEELSELPESPAFENVEETVEEAAEESAEEAEEEDEITPEDIPTDDSHVEEELQTRFGDTDHFMWDLSAELNDMEDVESDDEPAYSDEDFDEKDFDEKDFDEKDFDEEDFDEEDFEEAELEEEDFDEADFEEEELEEEELEEEATEEEELEEEESFSMIDVTAFEDVDEFDEDTDLPEIEEILKKETLDDEDDVKEYVGQALDRLEKEFDAETIEAEPTIDLMK